MNLKYDDLIKMNKYQFILLIEYFLKTNKGKYNKDLYNNILIDIDYYKFNNLDELDAYIIKNIIIDQIDKL